jgi:hypothetical protein
LKPTPGEIGLRSLVVLLYHLEEASHGGVLRELRMQMELHVVAQFNLTRFS